MAEDANAVRDGDDGSAEAENSLSVDELVAELEKEKGNNEKLLRVKAKLDRDNQKYRAEKQELNERLLALEAERLDEDALEQFKAFQEQSEKDPKKAEAGKLANELKKMEKMYKEVHNKATEAEKRAEEASRQYRDMMLEKSLQSAIGDKVSDINLATLAAKNSGIFALDEKGQLIVVDGEGEYDPEYTAEQMIDGLLEKYPSLKRGVIAPGSGADAKATDAATGDWRSVVRRKGFGALMADQKLYDANRDDINAALNSGELEQIVGSKAIAGLKPGVPLDVALGQK